MIFSKKSVSSRRRRGIKQADLTDWQGKLAHRICGPVGGAIHYVVYALMAKFDLRASNVRRSFGGANKHFGPTWAIK
jgi:hypothetical protein